MNLYFGELINWVSQHPNLAGIVICAVAFFESLALVGLFVPGALLMVGFGALVAVGALPFWFTMGWAISGAIFGDGLSYLIGAHFHERIYVFWPFSRHPELISRSKAFIRRHGGKSIFLGRFVGPVRSIVPMIAGMLKMSARRFLFVNVLSALAWAPVYLFPGIAIGKTLSMAREVASRFVFLLIS